MGSTKSTGLSLYDTLFIRYVFQLFPLFISSLSYLPSTHRLLCRHVPKSKLQGWYYLTFIIACKRIKYLFFFKKKQGNYGPAEMLCPESFQWVPFSVSLTTPLLSHTRTLTHIYMQDCIPYLRVNKYTPFVADIESKRKSLIPLGEEEAAVRSIRFVLSHHTQMTTWDALPITTRERLLETVISWVRLVGPDMAPKILYALRSL